MDNNEMRCFGVASVILLGGAAVSMLLQGTPTPPSPPPLPPTGKANFYGVVKNAVTGAVLGGVSVTADSYSTTTDAAGYFEILGLDAGTYSATFSKSGFEDYSVSVELSEGNNGYEVSLTPITSFILEFPSIDLLGINGKGVSEQGTVDGVPYITLVDPIVADSLVGAATFSLYNKSITLYSDNGYRDLAVQVWFDGVPLKVWGKAGIALAPNPPEQGYTWKPAPFSYSVTPRTATNNASWGAGVHNALVSLGGRLWDQSGFWPLSGHSFRVYNFIQCTVPGSVQVT